MTFAVADDRVERMAWPPMNVALVAETMRATSASQEADEAQHIAVSGTWFIEVTELRRGDSLGLIVVGADDAAVVVSAAGGLSVCGVLLLDASTLEWFMAEPELAVGDVPTIPAPAPPDSLPAFDVCVGERTDSGWGELRLLLVAGEPTSWSLVGADETSDADDVDPVRVIASACERTRVPAAIASAVGRAIAMFHDSPQVA